MRALLIITFILAAFPAYASRGFGTTYGVGTTDAIATTYATTPSSGENYSFWTWNHGTGGNSGGRVMNKGATAATVDAIIVQPSIQFFPAFSTTRGQWQSNAALSQNIWHHVLIVYDGSSVLNAPVFYVDGVSVAITQVTPPVGSRTSDAGAYVVGNTSTGNRNYDGMIADYAMWSGVSLTANHAAALASGASPLKIIPANLKLYLPLTGLQTGEPEWSTGHATQTLTGTKAGANNQLSMFYPWRQVEAGQ